MDQNLLKGDLGNSYFTNEPVLNIILQKMPVSFSIAILAELVAIILAIPLGVFQQSSTTQFMIKY